MSEIAAHFCHRRNQPSRRGDHDVDKRKPGSSEWAQYESGVWALLGARAEQSVFGEKEAD